MICPCKHMSIVPRDYLNTAVVLRGSSESEMVHLYCRVLVDVECTAAALGSRQPLR
jgi:hypothetical protein